MKKIIILSILFLFFFHSPAIAAQVECQTNNDCPPNGQCVPGAAPGSTICVYPPDSIKQSFGTIQVPDALKNWLGADPTGAAGIGKFLSNLIALIYTVAIIVLIFMLLWGAFEWLTSGGDKEKLSSAQKRIISAIIGIVLFAVAFAIIQVLGQFTGFTFFTR